MKFIKIVLGFVPFLTSAQVDLQAVGNCPETSYSFFRQGVREQEFTKTYDKQGRILKETNNFSSKNTGNYTEEYAYEYDLKGNNTVITYKRNNEVKRVIKKVFDATGQLLQESASAGGVNLLSVNTSSLNGTLKTQVFYGEDGKTETFREITSTNAKGQLLKKEVIDINGKILMSDTKIYSIQGKLTQDVHFDATDKVTTQTDFVYDIAGNLIRDKTLRNNVVFAETKHANDPMGKLIQKTRLNGKGQIDYYFTYEYDVIGNMTKENYFYNNQVISVRTFEYDLNGNKIKEIYLDKLGTVNMYKIWEFACK
jgi:hypothetical protein